jgi:asparagine synthase (glutamine-hydrolysing)
MTDVMVHRGPNDRGTYVADGVALGARRLSIVDVAGGHQPVSSEDGSVWAVQNGELYNHVDLRRELAAGGHRLRSNCDTEVLPHLYEHVGVAFAERLRGKFGIAVWDGRRRRGVLARDRLGVKPLYYARRGDLLVFASELKSLLASGLVAAELDYEAIDAYLTFGFVPAPKTPLAGVSKLMPGELLVVDAEGVRCERYWEHPPPAADSPPLSEAEYAEGLLAELEESVRLRLMSDVPLGAMLSGGLDSSLIVALMARNMSEPVKTFSVGFAEDGESNELADAHFVAGVFGADHHELELSVHEQAVDLAELVWHLDEPLADLSALGMLALSELAARHVTVALSGQGADELLAGYRKHRAASIVSTWNRLPGPIRRAGTTLALHGPDRFRREARTLAANEPVARLIAMSGQVDARQRQQLYRGELTSCDGSAAWDAVATRLNGVPDLPLPTVLYLDAQLSLPDLLLHYFDRASMAHSLEVRVPFLDHQVVEYCARIPANLKVRRLQTKHLLRQAARGLVPDRIIDKPKIGFFRNPSTSDAWLKAQMPVAIEEYIRSPSAQYANFLDRREVDALVARYESGGGARSIQLLLGILLLEIWLASYVPRALSAPCGHRRSGGGLGMTMPLTYAVVTPARDEAENLERLAGCMVAQTVVPARWVIVDDGSTDATGVVVQALAERHPWIRVATLPTAAGVMRGAPVVRAFEAGIASLGLEPDVVVKLDADVSFEADYFERLLDAFIADPSLGIASGSAYECQNGVWRQLHGTRTSVWGASRVYRWACLRDVSPLEQRMGWDGIDEFKANVGGWTTRTLLDLPFRHHRREGERDGSSWRPWAAQGGVAHFMGYRLSYLVARAVFRARRHPAALAMLWGYGRAALRGEPRCPDAAVRNYVRSRQRLRELPKRAAEALGRTGQARSASG